MLKAHELKAGYGRIPVLHGVGFEMAPGEFTGVLGRNGMGKTTLLRTLMGELPLTGGSLSMDGRDLGALAPYARARHGLGFVPQGRQIFPALTVAENLRMGCVKQLSQADAKIASVLKVFPRLQRLLDRPGGSLSGGEQQLLALARCLCGDPKLMLLDEPTEGIQPSICDEIVEALQNLRASHGIAILLVEQDIDFLCALSDRILVLEKGELIADVPTASTTPQEIARRYGGLQS
ncbi:ABC transporter ATP-binding protein [Achromobacter spanius]|jgi:urea ABC transporter ATP-binding protein UrtE|uniref:Urea ABC transporter ATP-binding protein n=1 Tax=Achromobacter spanius TaxID=217203 RepID=A0AAW3I0T4_9BURK|nr:ABC transporter ATP-binding protein [Achromobacter spanius]AZS77216.1 ABC transporter ATP-binding protein [Achromobacter spanius]KNE26425.1 urea ABC transporter ATP-binding protein [Achromobacter spanius]MCW3151492.1 ABC transporter ATP-binding protein [Achromobacter spanius]